MFLLSDYDYDLPGASIAQVPCADRSDSKLLRICRRDNHIFHHRFKDLTLLLRPGDLVVVNNTRVIPARLFGRKKTGGRVEVLIIDYASGMKNFEQTGFFQCDCLVRASKSPKPGAILEFEDNMQARVEEVKGYVSRISFLGKQDFPQFLRQFGRIPLPPYIKRQDDKELALQDQQDYQTVFAATEGAVAAPTAGLHFTGSLIADLEKKGVQFAPVTLHVGYGTFVPVRKKDIREHQIHSEYFSLSEESAARINQAKLENRRIVAVGTTSVRTLEYLADDNGFVKPGTGMCDLYIYPGYRFKCVDAIVTNFHLPESTLLMLVSAFYDRKKILEAYETAIQENYRFFSYGDAMLIE